MCTNKDGDVFIADSGYSKIFRYHHGVSVPYRAIHEPGMERASSCSVSPVTAELAVANHQKLAWKRSHLPGRRAHWKSV